jgi:hypothetical protein
VGNPVFNGKYFWFADCPVKNYVKLQELNGNCLRRIRKKKLMIYRERFVLIFVGFG